MINEELCSSVCSEALLSSAALVMKHAISAFRRQRV